jgi:hypothetical protein
LDPIIVRDIFRRRHSLQFKNEFWKQTNKEYFNLKDSGDVVLNFEIFESDINYDNSTFPTKLEIESKEVKFGSKYIFTLHNTEFEQDKKVVYDFIEEIIFENPISTLC